MIPTDSDPDRRGQQAAIALVAGLLESEEINPLNAGEPAQPTQQGKVCAKMTLSLMLSIVK